MSSIFLVDDHALVRDGIRAMVEAGGHEVVGVAEDPSGALLGLARHSPDLLLLDLGLAGERSGLELLAEMRRSGSRVRTLVLTMSLHARDLADALRLGAAGYLLKSTSRVELLAAIDAVMAGRRHLGAALGHLAFEAAIPASEGADPLAALSPRERQIITMVARGKTSPAIAQLLGLSPKTVDTYRSRLMAKLRLDNLAALVRFAVRTGLVDVNDE